MDNQLKLTAPIGSLRPEIIELFGLPGAGKTTITQGLFGTAGRHSRSEISSVWRKKSLIYRGALIVRTLFDLKWMACIVELVVRTPVRNRESLGRLARLTGTKLWLRSHNGEIVLDQGTLQSLWSIFYIESISELPNSTLVRLLRSFYDGLTVTIVSIDVPPETAAVRIHSRQSGSSRLDHLPEQLVLDRLENAERLPAGILRAAREAGLEVRVLDGSQKPELLASQLQTILDEQSEAVGTTPLSEETK